MAGKKEIKAKKVTKKKGGEKALNDLFGELMTLLGLKSKFDITEDKNNDAFLIDIKGEEETGLIIGARGKTLLSLQMLTGLMFKNITGEWKRIIINVSDYREKEEGRLTKIAEESAQRAIESGQTQNLYNLTAAQRRVVHMALSNNGEVVTESQGEGQERYLAISPKK